VTAKRDNIIVEQTVAYLEIHFYFRKIFLSHQNLLILCSKREGTKDMENMYHTYSKHNRRKN